MSQAIMRHQMAFTTSLAPTLRIFHRVSLTSPMRPYRPLTTRNKVAARMSIEQEVSQKMKEAMKAKDSDMLKALRGIRAAFLTASKEAGASDSLSDEVAVAQLRKLAKMRKESITMYEKGGREDLAQAEFKELQVIEQWLPKLADKETMEKWAREAIEKTGASKKGDMGKVMGLIMKEHKQEVDGSVLKTIVGGLLS